MAEVKWIKVSTNMFESSRKIKQIEVMPEGDSILVIWLKLLLLAGNINDGGAIYLTPEIPYTDEMLANELRRPITTVRLALSVFEKFGMIEIIDDILHLSSWEKYQNIDGLDKIREQNRIRKQRQRDNAKLFPVNDVSRDSHVTVTDSHAIEEEGEEDKELEYHSFIHADEQTETVENSVENLKKQRKALFGSLGKGVVFLSDEQIDYLIEYLSYDEFNHYVSTVAECELSGKKFKKKTHFQAILDMAAKDRKVSN